MFNFFKKKPKDQSADVKPLETAEESPWTAAHNAHNDRMLRMGAQISNWRKATLLSSITTMMAVAGLTYVALQPKFIPQLVEVDKLGQTVAVKAIYGDEAITDVNRLVYREMFDFFQNARSVTTDRQENNRKLKKVFLRLDGAANKYVRTELRKAPPNVVGASKTVDVKVRTAMPLTGKSWQIDWEEHSFNLAGEATGVEYWRSTVQYELRPTGTPSIFQENPIGFTITEISWQTIAQ